MDNAFVYFQKTFLICYIPSVSDRGLIIGNVIVYVWSDFETELNRHLF